MIRKIITIFLSLGSLAYGALDDVTYTRNGQIAITNNNIYVGGNRLATTNEVLAVSNVMNLVTNSLQVQVDSLKGATQTLNTATNTLQTQVTALKGATGTLNIATNVLQVQVTSLKDATNALNIRVDTGGTNTYLKTDATLDFRGRSVLVDYIGVTNAVVSRKYLDNYVLGITNPSSWSVYPAIQDANIGGYKLINVYSIVFTNGVSVNGLQMGRLLALLPPITDYYVATNGTGDGSSWSMATPDLQGAINSCGTGYTVWVSNGTYVGNFTIGANVTVKSKDNDPTKVFLDGGYAGSVVTLDPTAWLIGCTVSNGNAMEGGGIYHGLVSNCIVKLNYGVEGGGLNNATVYNSIISNNTANSGAGSFQSTLYNCRVRNNVAASAGGGLQEGSAYNCLIAYNRTTLEGFGGGGTFRSYLYNCTVVSNSAYYSIDSQGGGNNASYIYNSISWGNSYPDTWNGIIAGIQGTNVNSCGVDYTGTGSTNANPVFVSTTDWHLQTTSPCKDKGTNLPYTATTKDLDNYIRIYNVRVDMGAYEFGSSP